MLIDSDRLTKADREHWARLERYDRRLSGSKKLAKAEGDALRTLRNFREAGEFYAGVSWGKDSVVLAHLIHSAGLHDVSIIWFSAGRIENPDNVIVRDAFLAKWHINYKEILAVDDEPVARMGPGDDYSAELGHDGFQAAFERESKNAGHRYASGVRAEESRTRTLAVARYGIISTNTCRPIGRWTGDMVFAYLAKYDLPIHPAYAMTMGGLLDRRRIRVATIGGDIGRGIGRAQWERRYYGDVVDACSPL